MLAWHYGTLPIEGLPRVWASKPRATYAGLVHAVLCGYLARLAGSLAVELYGDIAPRRRITEASNIYCSTNFGGVPARLGELGLVSLLSKSSGQVRIKSAMEAGGARLQSLEKETRF